MVGLPPTDRTRDDYRPAYFLLPPYLPIYLPTYLPRYGRLAGRPTEVLNAVAVDAQVECRS